MIKRYFTIVIPGKYWKPGENYTEAICQTVKQLLRTGDVVVLSEKAVSIAKGCLADEALIRPGLMAKFLVRFWMRIVWGYFLAPVCRLSGITTRRLRSYPIREGATHKQLVLKYSGFLQALRHYSEGGIDVSNVPYSYAVLPLQRPHEIAHEIYESLHKASLAEINVLIVDSDKTYTWHALHISPRSTTVRGIFSLGVLAFLLGRAFRLRARSTPIAQAGTPLSAEGALRIAALANRARGSGAGRTVWDMAESFGVGLSEVSWESLSGIKHRPVVIVRRIHS